MQGPKAQRLVVSRSQSFQGPLPPPEILQGYEDVKRGFAERIMSQAERESAHRHATENRALEDIARETRLGQIFGLVIGLAGIAGGVAFAWMGHPGSGAVSVVGSMGTLAAAFIVGKRSEHAEQKKTSGKPPVEKASS